MQSGLNQRRCNLLLVEDQLDLAALMEHAFEDAGDQVTHAYSVFDALGLLDTQRFDGAVLDVELRDGVVFPWLIAWRSSASPICSSLPSTTSWCRSATAAQLSWPNPSTSISCGRPFDAWWGRPYRAVRALIAPLRLQTEHAVWPARMPAAMSASCRARVEHSYSRHAGGGLCHPSLPGSALPCGVVPPPQGNAARSPSTTRGDASCCNRSRGSCRRWEETRSTSSCGRIWPCPHHWPRLASATPWI